MGGLLLPTAPQLKSAANALWAVACAISCRRRCCARTWGTATNLDRCRRLGVSYAAATDAASEAVGFLCSAAAEQAITERCER